MPCDAPLGNLEAKRIKRFRQCAKGLAVFVQVNLTQVVVRDAMRYLFVGCVFCGSAFHV
jgi:hypothetical protein